MSGHCKECRFWGHRELYKLPLMTEPKEYEPTVYARKDIRDCARVNASGLIECDGEPCTVATLGTGPEFGCILYEPHPLDIDDERD